MSYMISKEQLDKYKQIYKKQYGKEISDQEAMEQGTSLLRLIQLVYKPITKADLDMVNKRRAELDQH